MVIVDDDRSIRADESLAGFAAALGLAGLPGSPDRTHSFLTAVSLGGADRRDSVYWAGRATLCASVEDLPIYDDAFTAWFATAAAERSTGRRRPPVPDRPQASINSDSGSADHQDGQTLIAQASAAEILRHRDVASLSDTERVELARLFATLPVTGPRRRSLRHHASRAGVIDVRRTLRAQLQLGGEATQLRYRRRGPDLAVWCSCSTFPGPCRRTPTPCSGSLIGWSPPSPDRSRSSPSAPD